MDHWYLLSFCVCGKKKIHFEPYTEEILFQKIVNMIYRYENQQTRGPLYLWEDIRMERLRLNHSVLLNNHRKIQEENQDLYEIFEAQLKSPGRAHRDTDESRDGAEPGKSGAPCENGREAGGSSHL